MGVVVLETFYLAPHVGAVAFVEVEKLAHSSVAGCLHIGFDEALRKITTLVVVEVHRQEGDFTGYIAVAEAIVELDTVENLDAIGEADMRSVKVAVAVPYSTPLGPFVEEGGGCLYEAPGVCNDIVVAFTGCRYIDILLRLAKVLLRIYLQEIDIAILGDLLICRCTVVKFRQLLRHSVDHTWRESLLTYEIIHHPVLRQLEHLHCVFNYVAFAINAIFAIKIGYSYNSQVDIGTEPPVQYHLLLAKIFPFLQSGIVQVAQVYRLLYLVYMFSGEEDKRHLRLHQVDFTWRLRIRFW